MPVHEFKVEMTCSGCSSAVERVLSKLGVSEISAVEFQSAVVPAPIESGLNCCRWVSIKSCNNNKIGAYHKVEKVSIDLDEKTVHVTSNMSADELLEVIKKTGKSTSYVGVKE